MAFLDHLRVDLKKSLRDQQRAAVVQILRQKLSTLTLDELRQLLGSPLGHGLGAMRVIDLVQPPAPGSAGPSAAAKVQPNQGKPAKSAAAQRKTKKPSAAKTKATKPRGRSKSKAPGRRKNKNQLTLTRAQPMAALLVALTKSAGPLSSVELSARLGIPRARVRDVLVNLVRTGRAHVEGEGKHQRFRLPSSPPPGPSSSATGAAEPTSEYAAAVLELIREAGDWISAGQIQPHVDGTPERLRLVLVELRQANLIERTGLRNKTRYRAVTPVRGEHAPTADAET